MSLLTCHLLGGDAMAAGGWAGFELPSHHAWTLLVVAADDGRTGLSSFDPPSSLLSALTREAHVWQARTMAFMALSSLDDTAIVKTLWAHASPAALVVTSPHETLNRAVAALKVYHAALALGVLQRRYGRPSVEPLRPALASLLDDSQPPDIGALESVMEDSGGIQLWRFAGGWGLHAILSGCVDAWRERLTAHAPVQQHHDVSSIPVW